MLNNIKQLLHNIPLDKVTSSGTLFWSGAKKPPSPFEFNPADPLHREFIVAVAGMRASVFGVTVPEWASGDPGSGSDGDGMAFEASTVMEVAGRVVVPVFRPSQDTTIALTEEEAKQKAADAALSADVDEQCRRSLQPLAPIV